MASGALITCILPTHARPSLLCRALDSVLEQTYDNLEVIVVVVPPHEPTRSNLDDYETRDDRIETIYVDEQLPPGAARNRAIRAATGDYIAFLDDDDVWEPKKLEHQEPYIQDYPFVSCLPMRMEAGGTRQIAWPDRFLGEIDVDVLFENDLITCTSSTMFQTSALQSVGGFDEDLVRGEIWDLGLKILGKYGAGYVVDSHLVRLDVDHDRGRVSAQPDNYTDILRTFHRHKDKISPSRARQLQVKIEYGGYKETDGIAGIRYLLASLSKDYELVILRQLGQNLKHKFQRTVIGRRTQS